MNSTEKLSICDIQNTTKPIFQEIIVDEQITLAQLKEKVAKGGRFVMFKYQISVIFAVTYWRFSPAIFVEKADQIKKYSKKYNLLSWLFGWWFFPRGPFYTISCLRFNLKGGLDVTDDIMLNIDEQGFADRNIKYLKTNQLFAKPDKWDLKSYRKVLPKRFERDFGIRKIVAANYINTDSPKATRVIGIKTISGYDKYIENCKEALAPEFRNYAHFEFIDLNQGDKAIGELLISQGEIIMDRDQPKM
jgi:hypothetical protein